MRESKALILIVDQAPEMRRLVRRLIQSDGFKAMEAGDIESGLALATTRYPDAVIVDIDLPDGNGFDLITALRVNSDVPVLVLTERAGEDDKVMALEVGADDYLVRPFGGRELLARLKAQLRRKGARMIAGSHILVFGDVQIDLYRRMVIRSGQPVHLTPIEYHLLTHLASNPHRIFLHSELLHEVWGSQHEDDTPYLRVYVRNLRKKIEGDPSHPRHLLTEANVGYRFVP